MADENKSKQNFLEKLKIAAQFKTMEQFLAKKDDELSESSRKNEEAKEIAKIKFNLNK